ncbi:MAG: LuxR C-terminal-related transcriptional regulator [Nitrososphaerales archaeon]
MTEADPLIRTKLRLPYTRRGLVVRPPLQEHVRQGLCGPLTLVTAPAGFGKTTLLASCVADCAMPVAWLSLDKDDNQPERFLRYLLAALHEAHEAVAAGAGQLLVVARPESREAILTRLVNDLASDGEMALVLDDYQFISSPAVHDQVIFLLDHCPSTFHLVIASRSDPPLPLALWRGRGLVVELRAADLAFTATEAAQFLNDVMALRLDAASVAVLEERTEGWIAGLQMAGLSLRGHGDPAQFIAGFRGTNRYILDYLLEEVLARQSQEVQRFLLHTSILERLAAPLCDAVLLGLDAARPEGRGAACSAAMLEYVERANLFLVPLDDDGTWYRYHHLFADLLRTQLQAAFGGDEVKQLHVRAAEWHAAKGSILEAINHASAAGDDERVERYIEQHYQEIVSRGEQHAMRFWSSKLRREQVYRRPWLCIYEAHSRAWFGELVQAEHLLDEAEKRMAEAGGPQALGSAGAAMLGHWAYVKSRVTAMRGDLPRAIQFCLLARENLPASNLSLQFNTRVTLGYEYFLAGDYAKASPILNEAIRAGIGAGALIYTVAAACMVARMLAVQGRLAESCATYQMAGQLTADAGGEHRDATALVEVGRGSLSCEWNDLDDALAHLQKGLDLLPFWGKADDAALAYLTLARVQLARSQVSGAAEALEKARQAVQAGGVFVEARDALEAGQVRLWLAQGNLAAAGRWAAAQEERLRPDDPFDFRDELARMNLVRVFLAQREPGKAGRLLIRLEPVARSAGRTGRLVEILALKAMALAAMDRAAEAMNACAQCLALAEPEGYTRIFLDEGQLMRLLLAEWAARSEPRPEALREYTRHLLACFDASAPPAAVQPGGEPSGGLIEPLSQREVEVLRLIALGHTNQAIAAQLIVAPGTVKAHTANIYRKLDVANRTEAVARGRALGLLS